MVMIANDEKSVGDATVVITATMPRKTKQNTCSQELLNEFWKKQIFFL